MGRRQTKTTDSKGRVTLPQGFANTTVIIEQVSDTEVRIRKAVIVPEDEASLIEQSAAPLSDRDRDLFLAMLDDPPRPSPALRTAVRMLNRQGKVTD